MRDVYRILRENAMPLLHVGLNLCLPPRCSACGCITESAHGLCTDCFRAIAFIDAPYCRLCGFPFGFALGEEALCGHCLHDAPRYHAARAVWHYDATTRELITRFKYHDRTDRAPFYGRLLARAAHDILPGSAVIVPVPLHPRRLLQRKYNQSALLAFALADQCHLPVLPDGLLRVRHTTPQAGLTRAQRLHNVNGAFQVNHRRAQALRGKGVLLIDDVMTTGATIEACVDVLHGGGAARVNVLTLARTVRE